MDDRYIGLLVTYYENNGNECPKIQKSTGSYLTFEEATEIIEVLKSYQNTYDKSKIDSFNKIVFEME